MEQLIRRSVALLAVAALLGLASTSPACPFCTMQGKTLSGDVSDASMVLYGKLTNANEKAETTDILIETIIKDNEVRGTRKRLTLSRFVDLEATTAKDRYIVFCDLFRGGVDPYRGLAVKVGSKLPEYLRGAMQLKGKPVAQRLRFFFNYLDSDDAEMSNDAYKEFANADYKQVAEVAKTLPVDRVVKWLKSSDTPSFRIGLYASILAHAGKEKDAEVLKKLLADEERRQGSGVDGLIAGYTLLKPKEGWPYLLAALKNTKEDFMFRYSALRALRFLHDFRTDVVKKKDLVAGLCVLLDQEDIADLAIEDLRKWQCWDHTDQVLAICKKEAYKLPIVKRAILRYCLECPASPAAAAHVAQRRKADPDAVTDAEELLKLEKETLTPSDKPVVKK